MEAEVIVVNRFIGVGRIGRVNEVKYLAGGGAVLGFSLCMNERYQKDGEDKETTFWLDCNVWGKRAESLAKVLAKGSQVYVEGSLQSREWEKDNITFKRTELRVSELKFVGSKPKDSASEWDNAEPVRSAYGEKPAKKSAVVSDDDIPF